ncbi:hypothetical protein SAMN05192553_102655 [Cyclobacterium xiamenense]|uniref:Uncharacterized protein n=1 Tax=Cyclobacterium xiamenense TaxID=1297121 RepID=A0A1H6WJM6_9BACT|nr:hypothetical protein SAMN05192553_102655 [Cyclobacterium xiamenense]
MYLLYFQRSREAGAKICGGLLEIQNYGVNLCPHRRKALLFDTCSNQRK